MIPRRTFLASSALAAAGTALAADKPVRVLVWDERQSEQKKGYGDAFLGDTIAAHLKTQPGLEVESTHMGAEEMGLAEAVLEKTDVIIWWSHRKNPDIPDELARRVMRRVLEGEMGLIALHSAHWAKPFVFLMQARAKADALAQIPAEKRAGLKLEMVNQNPIGRMVRPESPPTPKLSVKEDGSYSLFLPGCIFPAWRADGAPSHVTTLLPDHPIAAGLPKAWDIPQTEMYGEPFHVPAPDAVVFEERWDKGEHFRSGCVWKVGQGRVFYFRPGHETFSIFKQAEPLRVLVNAVRWLGAKS